MLLVLGSEGGIFQVPTFQNAKRVVDSDGESELEIKKPRRVLALDAKPDLSYEIDQKVLTL
jgi:hypothetical protein